MKLTEQKYFRGAATLCAGLLQGFLMYAFVKGDWFVSMEWPYTACALLPLPFYIARNAGARAAACFAAWGALRVALDGGRIYTANPYGVWTATNAALFFMSFSGALMLLPCFLSLAEGGPAFPSWPVMYRHYSRMFFTSIIVVFFISTFVTVLFLGVTLTDKAGGLNLRRLIFSKNIYLYWMLVCGAAAVTVYRISRADGLLDALNRYVTTVFAWILPMLSAFVLIFIVSLPLVGIDALWSRGLSSALVLEVYAAFGLCSFAAWQGGEGDEPGQSPREPFIRPVAAFVKIAAVLLPVLGILLVRTIGIRVEQYGWTVVRAVSTTAAVMLGVWSAAWAYFLIARRRDWPKYYGRVNRVAFPLVGVALILLSSPVLDVRRIVLGANLKTLSGAEAPDWKASNFDWRYMGRDLGVYGVRALESFDDDADGGGSARLREYMGPSASDARIMEAKDEVKRTLASLKRAFSDEPQGPEDAAAARDERLREITYWTSKAPALGGELSAAERGRIAEVIASSNIFTDYSGRDYFLLLADMDGDGQNETLASLGGVMFLVGRDKVFRLREEFPRYSGVPESRQGKSSDLEAALAGEYSVVPVSWDLLEINGRAFSVSPSDFGEIAGH
jgi:hypothetical protein